MRIGLRVAPQHCTYKQMRDTWLRAEDEGADSLFTWDHFYPLFGDPDGAHFECWSLLAAMAEATERIHFGALVTCNSYRNPNLLADMARTVDHISGGRLILGLGSGWFERDYDEYGYEFGTRDHAPAGVPRRPAGDRRAPRQAQPAARARQDPDPHRRRRREGDAAAGRAVGRHLARLRRARGDRAQVPRAGRALRRVGRDPAEIERSVLVTSEDIATGLLDRYYEAGARHFVAIAKEPDFDLADLRRLHAWRDSLMLGSDVPAPLSGRTAGRRARMEACEHCGSDGCAAGRAPARAAREYAPGDGGRAFRRPARRALRRGRRGCARRALRPLRPGGLRPRAAHRARRDAGRGRRAGGVPRPLAHGRPLRSGALAAGELPADVRPSPRRRSDSPRAGAPAARRRRRGHRVARGQATTCRPRWSRASRARACAARSPTCRRRSVRCSSWRTSAASARVRSQSAWASRSVR